jgi:hypothetical protein
VNALLFALHVSLSTFPACHVPDNPAELCNFYNPALYCGNEYCGPDELPSCITLRNGMWEPVCAKDK